MDVTHSNPAQANGRSSECDANRVEPRTGLPLPDPYPEYLACPHCGEPEVEVWCYQTRVRCHRCGVWLAHTPPLCRGSSAVCRLAVELEEKEEGEDD